MITCHRTARSPWALRVIAFALLPSSSLLAAARGAEAEDDGLKAEIARIWEQRQEECRTVHLEWTMIGRRRASGLGPQVLKAIGDRDPDIGEFLTFEQSMSLRLDGEKLDWRLETKEGETLRMPIGLRSAYDGEVSQEFSGRPLSKGAVPSGAISNEKHAYGTRLLYVKPALVLFRPLTKSISGLDWSSCRILPDRVLVGDRQCVVAQYQHAESPLRDVYYLDEARAYILARYQQLVEDRESSRIDVTYAEDAEHEFVPASWVCTSFDGEGQFSSSRECNVTHVAINIPIPHEEFQIAYPPGTSLEDLRTGQTYQVPAAQDGRTGQTPPVPAAREPNDAAHAARQKRRLLLSVGSLVLIVVVAALVARSRFKNRA